MHKRPGHSPQSQVYDASKGQQALDSLRPQIDALPADSVDVARVDLERVAIMLLGVGDRIQALRHRFERLPPEEFDASQLDLIEPLAWALWFLHHQTANAPRLSEAKIPAALATEAADIEARMQRCCEYHLLDDETAGPKLLALRPGTGYRDLAGDLVGYAEIYRSHHAVVSEDRKNYRPSDAKRAVEIATTMLKLLGADGADSQWAPLRNKVWTLAVRKYGDIAKTGSWLLRNETSGDSAFPNIYFAGRPATGSTSAAEPAQPPAASPPQTPTA